MARVLGEHDSRASLASEGCQWQAEALEQAVVEAGGCAAAMRSARQWQAHPQGGGQSRNRCPIETPLPSGSPRRLAFYLATGRCSCIQVLDLTRIIAGPVATRLLAGLRCAGCCGSIRQTGMSRRSKRNHARQALRTTEY